MFWNGGRSFRQTGRKTSERAGNTGQGLAASRSSLEQLAEQLHALMDGLPEPTRCLLNILWVCETAPSLNIQVRDLSRGAERGSFRIRII